MFRTILRLATGALIIGVICFHGVTFQVREGERSVVTRFGRPVNVATDPGLHWKWPWPFEKAIKIDGRRRVFNTRHMETLTRDKKNIILLSYAVWRVDDPLVFYQSIGTIKAADQKLDGLIANAKNNVLGKYPLSALVSTNPDDLHFESIEKEILANIVESAKEKYGIELVQVGFKRLSLPEENVKYVFEQMRAERAQYAARYRAEGEREASKIRSETDLAAARIRAEAKEKAARIRGDAEAEAARIYSSAHSLDPEFYRFVRSMESLNKLIGNQTTVILRTDSDPFIFLKSMNPGK